MQSSRKDLENFLKWIQEAETTVNVLADASQRENALQDTVLARELTQQMQASAWETAFYFNFLPSSFDPSTCKIYYSLKVRLSPYSVMKSILLCE